MPVGTVATELCEPDWDRASGSWRFRLKVECDFKLWIDRLALADAKWTKMKLHCLGRPSDIGRSGGDNRLFLEAVLWLMRTGRLWHDLPAMFAIWSTRPAIVATQVLHFD